ncbi:hypothetical protein [Halobacillus litoralis]
MSNQKSDKQKYIDLHLGKHDVFLRKHTIFFIPSMMCCLDYGS